MPRLIRSLLISFFFLYSNAFALTLSEAEYLWLEQNPIIHMGSDSLYAPLEMLDADGKRDGLSGDYISIIKSDTGLSIIDNSGNSWAETYGRAISGSVDVLSMIKETEERKNKFIFTKPYITLDSAIITSKLVNDVHSLNDLTGRKISVVKGYFWHELLEHNHPEIIIVPVTSLAEGLKNTAFGTTDAMLATLATATHYLDQEGISNLKVAGLAPYKTDYGMAVRKDWPELVGILNKVFDNMSSDAHSTLKSKWVNLDWQSELVKKESLYWTYGLVLLLFTLCGALLLFVRLLRTQVKKRTLEIEQAKKILEITIQKRTRELTEANAQLKSLSQKDALTGISNRRHFNEHVSSLLTETGDLEDVTIILIDIDNFKAYNDNYGHQAGDQCIIAVANFLQQYCKREGEVLARFGGEEFILLLNRTNADRALSLANTMLNEFNSLHIPHAHSAVAPHVTLSFGVSTASKPKHKNAVHDLIQSADSALYKSKEKGKNQITQF